MQKDELMDIFTAELEDLYDAEQQIAQAMPQMINNARDPQLKTGLEEHLVQTKEQINRLEEIGSKLDLEFNGRTCKAMEGIIKENNEMLSGLLNGMTDVVINSGAQKIEHYEMAGYNSAILHAQLLGEDDAQVLLEETLAEEEEASQKLDLLAEDIVSGEAAI